LAKAFPFGFGPGKNCKVEEIGEISDDEENWGDYQNGRRAEDEYSEARNAYTMLGSRLSVLQPVLLFETETEVVMNYHGQE
jgi:hypothetical protein